MFVAASTRCFWDVSLDEALSQIEHFEFDRFELWIDPASEFCPLQLITEDIELGIARLRELTRMNCVALNLEADIGDDEYSKLIQFAKLARVSQLSIRASEMGTPFNTEIDRLRQYTSVAERDGVRVSIRTEKGRLSQDPHTAVELCQAVEGLGITLDPSHYVYSDFDTERALDLTLPKTYHVHLRDSSPDRLQVPLGLGEVDYSRIINQLRKQDFAGTLSVDLIPELTTKDERPLEMRKLRRLLESLL